MMDAWSVGALHDGCLVSGWLHDGCFINGCFA